MKKMILMLTLMLAGSGLAFAGTVEDKLAEYKAAGAGPFDAEHGKTMWTLEGAETNEFTGKPMTCATCHGTDLTQEGHHYKTGKLIEPMALSANPERLTDPAKIEKWFLRNCKGTWGRECTEQEKGDFLLFIQSK